MDNSSSFFKQNTGSGDDQALTTGSECLCEQRNSECRHSGWSDERETHAPLASVEWIPGRCFASPKRQSHRRASGHRAMTSPNWGVTSSNMPLLLAARCARVMPGTSAQRRARGRGATLKRGRGECRVPDAPAASCAHGSGKCARVFTASSPESPGIPARNGFTAYFVTMIAWFGEVFAARTALRGARGSRPDSHGTTGHGELKEQMRKLGRARAAQGVQKAHQALLKAWTLNWPSWKTDHCSKDRQDRALRHVAEIIQSVQGLAGTAAAASSPSMPELGLVDRQALRLCSEWLPSMTNGKRR